MPQYFGARLLGRKRRFRACLIPLTNAFSNSKQLIIHGDTATCTVVGKQGLHNVPVELEVVPCGVRGSLLLAVVLMCEWVACAKNKTTLAFIDGCFDKGYFYLYIMYW
jgi:hypothetical protein